MFNSEKLQHFSIRKLTVGAASVLIGVSFLMNTNNREVHADTIDETTQDNQVVNNSADTAQKAEPAKVVQEVPAQDSAKAQNTNSQAEMPTNQTKKVSQDTITNSASKSADLTQNTDAKTKVAESVSNNQIDNQSSNVQNAILSKQAQNVDKPAFSSDEQAEKQNLAKNKTPMFNILAVKQNQPKTETNLTENKVEKQTADNLSASLTDGTTITISRNTIGATGDTSPLTLKVVYHGVKQGDVYTITVPNSRAYSLSNPQSQKLQSFGSTDVQSQNNATEIINTFDKDTNEGNVTAQTFTLIPGSNYIGQSVAMTEIGDVIKTITIDKKSVDGSTDKASLNIKQTITPEMNPTVQRIIPNSKISEVYNATDYTYELRINETDGIEKGMSYASGQVNNAVNSGTTITIPVPPDFVLDTYRTAISNDFKRDGDQTTITQIGGKGGNIIINAPKGSGRQGYEDTPGYRLVGYYENAPQGVTHANGKITIHQLVTRNDGSTYYIDRELDPWKENITTTKSDGVSPIQFGVNGYSPNNVIPYKVDQTRPINSFSFANISAGNLENPNLKINFDNNLRINRITTPVNQLKLPGLTNYQYTAQLSDGRTIKGNIEAGKELTTNDGIYIKNIVLTPNMLAAGAGMDQGDTKNQIKAYGTISDTLENNDTVNTRMGADYTINNNGKIIYFTITTPFNCEQIIQEPSAHLDLYAKQSEQALGSVDSGYMSIYRSLASISATLHEVEEPILYYVLPKYTSYNKNIGVTVSNSGAKVPPKVTTFMADDHEVVKIDFTGTGDKISTMDNGNTGVHLDISALAKPGSYKGAIYIESPKTAMSNPKAKSNSFYNPAFTEGKTDRVYEVGQTTWVIGSAIETGIVGGALGNQNTVSVSRGKSNDKGDPNMAFDFNFINRNGQLDDVTAVVDLSDHDPNAFNFELNEPITIEKKEPNDHTEILYSVDKFAKPNATISYQPDLSNFKTADQMSKDDWKNVKAIVFKIGNLDQNSNSSVFRIHGRDNTLASDAGKSYSYSTYFFGTGILPSYTSYSSNPSITISGKSTVKYQMHYTDNKGQEHTVELNDLNKTYNDNQDNMADKASVINDFTNYAKTHDIIPANYKLGDVEIIDGNKTWQIAEPNKKIDFGEKIQYFADGDIVQIDLVPNTKGSVKVIYHDDTNNTDLTNYDYNSDDQYDGTSIGYNSSNVDTVKNELIKKGYKYVSIDGTIPAKIIGNQNNIITVHFTHDTFGIDHQHPFGKYTETDLQKIANRTINYVDEHGQTVKDSSKVAVIFNATGVVDKVTGNLVTLNSDGSIKDQKGQLSWTSTANGQTQNGDSYGFEAVPLDKNLNHNGTNYRLDHVDPSNMVNGDYIKSSTVTAENPQDQTITVVYHTITYHESKPIIKAITRTINYVDAQNEEKIIPSTTQKATLSRTQILDDQGNVIGFGSVNSNGKSYVIDDNYKINNGWITIDVPDLTSRGYQTNEKQVAGEEVGQNSQDKVVTVSYDHILVPVDEHSQDKHGVPIRDLAKDVHETVHFVDENGNKLRDDNVQTRHYTRTVTVDLTNNQIVPNPATDVDWHLADNQDSDYSEVKAPVITGYFADKKAVPSTKVVQDEINQIVTYKKIGSVIAIDKDGHQLADPIQFANDENDPTKAVAVNAPTVLNYHLVNSNDKVVKPNNDLTQDVKVVYAKDQGSVKVVFIDDTTGETLSNVGYNSGNVGFDTPITYTTDDDLAKLTRQGYVYSSTDGNIPEKVVANQNIAVAVHVRHGIITIDPQNPGKPNEKINPQDPSSPVYPAGSDKLTSTINREIDYVYTDGRAAKPSVKDSITFNNTEKIDKVTGKIISSTWDGPKDFADIQTPVIEGYTPDKSSVVNKAVTHTTSPIKVIVKYSADPQHMMVIYRDLTDNRILNKITKDGVSDEDGHYNTKSTIDGYLADGYLLSKDDTNGKDLIFDHNDKLDQTYYVDFTHGSHQYNPEKPGPKDKVAKNDYLADYNTVISYVDSSNKKLMPDKTVTDEYQRNLTIDSVTGNIIKRGDWTLNKGYILVENPVITGYITSAKSVTPVDKQENQVINVVYNALGKVHSVDNKGKEIAKVFSYTNDPSDPTKVLVTKVPSVAGYEQVVFSVDPTKEPTKDTTVVFNAPATVTVNYVDSVTGKTVHTDTVKGFATHTSDYTTQNEIGNLVKQGYVLAKDNVPSSIKLTENPQNYSVILVHGISKVTHDKPIAPDTPISNTNQKMPKGVDKDDLNREITRTITVIDPHTGQHVTKQVAKLFRDATVDNVTGVVTYTDWNKGIWDEFTTPIVAGYTPSQNNVPAEAVTHETKDSAITITYAPNPQTGKISYVDTDGKEVTNTPLTGKTDENVKVTPVIPHGWVVVDGQTIPNTVRATADGIPTVTIKIKHGTIEVTPDKPKTPNDKMPDGDQYPDGVTQDDLNRDITRTINVANPHTGLHTTVQTAHLSRNAVVDLVTKAITYGKWSTGNWDEFDAPTVAGYTPSIKSVAKTPVDISTKNTVIDITYTANPQTGKISYVDTEGKEVAKTDLHGKTDEDVQVKPVIPHGWVVVDGQTIPNTVRATADGIPTVTIKIKHGILQVTPDKPHNPDEKMPDGDNYPKGVGHDDLNKDVTRQIILHEPNCDKTVNQVAKYTRIATIDLVTGKVTYSDWNTTHGWDEYTPEAVTGYTPSIDKLAWVDKPDKDTKVEINYTATPSNDNWNGEPIQPSVPNQPEKPVEPAQPTDNNKPAEPTKKTQKRNKNKRKNKQVKRNNTKRQTNKQVKRNNTKRQTQGMVVQTGYKRAGKMIVNSSKTDKQLNRDANNGVNATTLPQTGEKRDTTEALAGILLASIGIATAIGAEKRKKRESITTD